MARPQHQFEFAPLIILISPKGDNGGDVGVDAKHEGKGVFWPPPLEWHDLPTCPRSTMLDPQKKWGSTKK